MNDLQAAAERFRSAEYIGSLQAYGGDDYDERADNDAYELARAYVELFDSTPLKDLTDEQWRELGFEWVQDCVPQNMSFWSFRREHWITYRPDTAKLYMPGYAVIEDFTLGQLRHLLAALGGEE